MINRLTEKKFSFPLLRLISALMKIFALLFVIIGLYSKSEASKVHSSLALGLCMKKRFANLIQSNLKDENGVMAKLENICSVSSLCRSNIENDTNQVDSRVFRDFDESFHKPYYRDELVSPVEAFQDLVSALPGSMAQKLVNGCFCEAGNLIPRVYTDISEFGRHLDENAADLQMYFEDLLD